MKLIPPKEFHDTVQKLRAFFMKRDFLEVHTQSRLSILAACEDPLTIGTFSYAGQVWPLPQTGQMWLEYELLKKPTLPGLFCVSTSFRNEPNPVEGRHDLIFPMFEFEMPGKFSDLIKLEKDLCVFLGFRTDPDSILVTTYEDACKVLSWSYNIKTISFEEEAWLCRKYGDVVILTDFPEHTSPFWNMKRNPITNISKKADVLIKGIETIGSAERSCDTQEMWDSFHTISDGKYADTLFATFGKERVRQELSDFLALPMFPRVGGGIGMTRLIKALT